MSARPARQVRFVGAQTRNLTADRCAIDVEMRSPAAVHRGTAEGGCGEPERVRCAAQAAVGALRELGHAVELEEVETVDVLGYPSVAVRVNARHNGESRQLVGFCVSGTDPVRASALAVLNATNRFLDIG